MPTCLPARAAAALSFGLAAAACAADEPAPSTTIVRAEDRCTGDYCEVRRFGFAPGAGLQLVGVDTYCARSGYPDGVLEVTGLDPRDVIPLPLDGGDLLLLGDPGDVALVRAYGERGEDCAVGVSAIEFEDGTRWTTGRRGGPRSDVPFERRRLVEGGAGADRLRGGRRVDALLGRGGDDRLEAGGQDDALSGGAGDDRLDGEDGDDVLLDGPGRDLLAGGRGDDVYLIDNQGLGGTDTIDDRDGSIRLVMRGAGLHGADEALFTRERDDLVLGFSRAPDRIVLRDHFRGGAPLASVGFDGWIASGADLDDRLRDARLGTPVLRHRDPATGLVQASADGRFSLACADREQARPLGRLPLVVLNQPASARFQPRLVASDCGDVAALVDDAIVGTRAPACPPPGQERTCRITVEARDGGRVTNPVTIEVFTADYL